MHEEEGACGVSDPKYNKSIQRLIEFVEPAISELKSLKKMTPENIVNCPHTCATPSMRILINKEFLSQIDEDTLVTFLLLTAIDQILFFKAKNLSRIFKRMYPELPIPMRPAGMGCYRVMSPKELIQAYYNRNRISGSHTFKPRNR